MQFSAHCDWIEYTIKGSQPVENCLPALACSGVWKEEKAHNGYSVAARNDIGVCVSWGPERMGTHVTIGGQALGQLRELGLFETDICEQALRLGASATRLDVCVNVHGGALTPLDVRNQFQSKQVKTRAKSGHYIESLGQDIGGSVYIGSRKTDRFMRIYDKAAELRLPDGSESWLRFELVLRRDYAKMLMFEMATTDNLAALVKSAVADYAFFAGDEFAQAMADRAAPLPKVHYHDSLKTLDHARRVIVSSTRKLIAAAGGEFDGVLRLFHDAIGLAVSVLPKFCRFEVSQAVTEFKLERFTNEVIRSVDAEERIRYAYDAYTVDMLRLKAECAAKDAAIILAGLAKRTEVELDKVPMFKRVSAGAT